MKSLLRPRRRCLFQFLTLGLMCLVSFSVMASEPWARVEEDWELAINQPDVESYSPQIALYLTPDATQPQRYFQLQLNHAADEGFSGGGFKVAAVSDGEMIEQARSVTSGTLSQVNDRVAWTKVIAKQDGLLLFAIKNGSSRSWGNFGGPDYLVRMPAGSVADLSHYSPYQSVRDVDIGFGRNRVDGLVLRRVRLYRNDGTCIRIAADLHAE